MTSQQSAVARPAERERVEPEAAVAVKKPNTLLGDVGAQVFLIIMALIVLFPLLWVVAIALDPRDITRPDTLIPPSASLSAFQRILTETLANGVFAWKALFNSLLVAGGTSLLAGAVDRAGAGDVRGPQTGGRADGLGGPGGGTRTDRSAVPTSACGQTPSTASSRPLRTAFTNSWKSLSFWSA